MTRWTQYWNGVKVAEGESEGVFESVACDDKIEKGRTSWRWLHDQCATDSLTPEREIDEFRPMIPAYGCTCLSDWAEIIKANPVPETDQAAWAIRLHNIVNEKIGKPQWTGITGSSVE